LKLFALGAPFSRPAHKLVTAGLHLKMQAKIVPGREAWYSETSLSGRLRGELYHLTLLK
jgi:hypothetical protein